MTDSVPNKTARPSTGLQAALKAHEHDFLVAGVITQSHDSEGDDMNLVELRKKSTAELRDLYNELVAKNIKRFETRRDAERRTAAALKDAGKWTGQLPDGKAAPAPAAKGAKGGKATPTAPKTDKPAKAKRAPGAGRPAAKNAFYRAKDGKHKMNSGSARTKVFLYVQENGSGKAGIDRESIENHFVNDESINVPASLAYLVKMGIIETVSVG